MRIDQFKTVIDEQLDTLGGVVKASVTPEERGYYLTLRINEHTVSKFYADNAVATYPPQLVRVQVGHLYNQLAQAVLDTTLGEGQINVIH